MNSSITLKATILNNITGFEDFLIVPFWLLVAYFISTRIKKKNISEKPYYKYFSKALFIKLFAGLAFAFIYLYYYGGGDTLYYFWGSQSVSHMFFKSVPTFIKIIAGDQSLEVYSMFDYSTGWPTYWRDANSFAVCRFNVPFYWLGFGSFLGNTLVMNLFLFFALWRFYEMLIQLYPNNEKQLAWALFYIPSVVFWSSGLLKDAWSLTGLIMIYTSIYQFIFLKERKIVNIFWILFWSYVLFAIRPFMFYIAAGSALIWVLFNTIEAIKSRFLRTIALPILIMIGYGVGSLLFLQTSSKANDRYSSMDSMLETAWIIQDDLKRDYYGGNTFDIGYFEPTLPGIIKKAPQAIIAGLYRPFIWEGDGILMILSGLENCTILFLSLFFLIKGRIFLFIRKILKDPLLFSFSAFAIVFGFMVGLTTSNFGALVRYAIPSKLMLALVLTLMYFYLMNNKKE